METGIIPMTMVKACFNSNWNTDFGDDVRIKQKKPRWHRLDEKGVFQKCPLLTNLPLQEFGVVVSSLMLLHTIKHEYCCNMSI